MSELDNQIKKMKEFAVKNNYKIHPKRIAKGGIPYMAEIFVGCGHCPCVVERKSCPCNEAKNEIEANGFCECRLFVSKDFEV